MFNKDLQSWKNDYFAKSWIKSVFLIYQDNVEIVNHISIFHKYTYLPTLKIKKNLIIWKFISYVPPAWEAKLFIGKIFMSLF